MPNWLTKFGGVVKRYSLAALFGSVVTFFAADYLDFVDSEKSFVGQTQEKYEESRGHFESVLQEYLSEPTDARKEAVEKAAFTLFQEIERAAQISSNLESMAVSYGERVYEVQSKLNLASDALHKKPLMQSIQDYKLSSLEFDKELSQQRSSYWQNIRRSI